MDGIEDWEIRLTAQCGAPVRVTDSEKDYLEALDRATDYLTTLDRTCFLAPDHPGAHAVDVQCQHGSDADPVVSWWLIWGAGARDLRSDLGDCRVDDPIWPDAHCYLYAGHLGGHVFREPPRWLPDH